MGIHSKRGGGRSLIGKGIIMIVDGEFIILGDIIVNDIEIIIINNINVIIVIMNKILFMF